jgi:hypothetical protein
MRMVFPRISKRWLIVLLGLLIVDLAPVAWDFATLESENGSAIHEIGARFRNAFRLAGLFYFEVYLILFQSIVILFWLAIRRHRAHPRSRKA